MQLQSTEEQLPRHPNWTGLNDKLDDSAKNKLLKVSFWTGFVHNLIDGINTFYQIGAVSPCGEEVIGGANNLFARKCLPNKDSLKTYIEKRYLRSYTTT
jgi:hypothetical protein